MKISYKWLETYFAKGFVQKTLLRKGLPSPEKLAEIFSAHAFEVEGIEKIAPGAGAGAGPGAGPGAATAADTVFDIKVLPDRAHYALSHKGIAREASVLTGAKLVSATISAAPTTIIDPTVKTPKVRVEEPKLCPRYMLRAIRDVAAGESPEWLRGRLEAVGARSINNIVDATNFVMLDLGQPLHAFDADKVRGTITIRLAKPDEKITILDGREIALLPTDLLIADDEGPLAIAGTKGGKRAEVTAETRNILIESANFNPTSVRKTSTRTNLRNDSSKRFENEITPALAAEAMDAVTQLIAGFSVGASGAPDASSTSGKTDAKISAITDIYPNPAKPWVVNVSAGFISSVIGQNVSAEKIKSILESEGCHVEIAPAADSNLSITPPLDRLDMRIPEDVADEIARIMGYDKLPARETPDLGRAVPIDPVFYYSEQIKNVLTGLGFSEVQTYSLVPKGAFEISYPLASDKAALRESIVPKLREAITGNSLKADLLGLQDIQMFEIGKVFPKTGEKTVLAIGAAPIKKKKGVTGMSIVENALKVLQEKLGVPVLAKTEDTKDAKGFFVEIDLDVIVSKLAKPTNLADLNFKSLPQDKKYVPFSAYPFIVRDIAMFVPSGTDESAIISTIKSQASELLVKGPDLFDKFEKDGQVSYAFRMIFQSFDRTLSDEEVNGIMSKIYDAVKAKNWQVR